MEIISKYIYDSNKASLASCTASTPLQKTLVDAWYHKTNHHRICRALCGIPVTPLKIFSFQCHPRLHLCASTSKKQWKRNNFTVLAEASHDFEMLGISEFAARMGVCSNTVRNWISDGKLIEGAHFLHISRIYRFPWSQEFVEKLMQTLAPTPPPTRPGLRSLHANRAHLKFRA